MKDKIGMIKYNIRIETDPFKDTETNIKEFQDIASMAINAAIVATPALYRHDVNITIDTDIPRQWDANQTGKLSEEE